MKCCTKLYTTRHIHKQVLLNLVLLWSQRAQCASLHRKWTTVGVGMRPIHYVAVTSIYKLENVDFNWILKSTVLCVINDYFMFILIHWSRSRTINYSLGIKIHKLSHTIYRITECHYQYFISVTKNFCLSNFN